MRMRSEGWGLLLCVACSDKTTEAIDLSRQGISESALRESSEAGPPSSGGMARAEELAEWVMAGHQINGRVVRLTEKLADGRTVDWIETASLPGGGAPAPSPPGDDVGRPAGTEASQTETLFGPPGTVPYIRPVLSEYVEGRYPATSVDEYYRSLPHGSPFAIQDDVGARLYLATRTVSTNFGGIFFANDNWTGTDLPSGGAFVIAEIAAFCMDGDEITDLVGVVVGRHPAYGSGHVLGIEYWSASDGTRQWVTGGAPGAWVQTHSSFAPGVLTGSASSIGGTQWESAVVVWYVDNDPVYDAGWWVAIQGNTLGYIPSTAANFSDLDDSACRVYHYVEAYDPQHGDLDDPWMSADMGSGTAPTSSSASVNFGDVAYLRRPGFYTQKNGQGYQSIGAGASPTDEWCYDGSRSTDGGSSWNPTIWYGGGGGNSGVCNQDPLCLTGIAGGGSTACCDPRCGTCGGSGCSSYWPPGGSGSCCVGTITSAGESCSSRRPPCEL